MGSGDFVDVLPWQNQSTNYGACLPSVVESFKRSECTSYINIESTIRTIDSGVSCTYLLHVYIHHFRALQQHYKRSRSPFIPPHIITNSAFFSYQPQNPLARHSNMHASILFLLSITALATTRSAGTYGWTSIGCYVDSGNRLLGPVWVNDNNNNVGDCLVRCRGYKYGMVENARYILYIAPTLYPPHGDLWWPVAPPIMATS